MKSTGHLTGIMVFIFFITWFPGQAASPKDTLTKPDSTAEQVLKQTLPMVTAIKSTNRFRDKNTLLFGDHVIITVKNLSVFLAKVDSCKAGGKPDTLCPVELFINGMPADDIRASSINKINGTVTFFLNRKSVTLNKLHFQMLWSAVPTNVSLGLAGSEALTVEPTLPRTYFKYITDLSLIVVLIMVIAMLITFYLLVKNTNLIRVTHSKSKYSLGLAQLLFWVFLIALAFIYIWITTSDMYPITGSVLVLLTISLTTSGGARLVDKARDPNRIFASTSESFFRDILSDDVGFSVHRVQMAIWTVILGIVFIYEVVVKQQMPQFDANLLLLMGISSTGYVGLKSIETIKSEIPSKGIPKD